jgi:hypothetical protein
MDGIADLTGQTSLLSGIVAKLNKKGLVRGLLEGPSGCGKSWLLQQLLTLWEQQHHKGIILSGDRAFSDRGYAPWFSGLSRAEDRLESKRLIQRAVSETGKMIPAVGNLVTFALDILLDSKEKQQRSKTLHLNSEEHEILFRLQSFAGNKPLLVIADDMQYWDHESLRLLLIVLSSQLDHTYPFLTRTHFIAATTRDSAPRNPDLWSQLISEFSQDEWHLEYVTEEKLGGILSAFGLKNHISKEQTALIYSVAGGHLELLRQLVDYYGGNQLGHGPEIGFKACPSLDIYAFLHRLIKERLDSLGVEGQKTMEVLTAASVIGRSFTNLEINCITGSASYLAESLQTAEKMRFLELERNAIRFSHEALRDSLLRATSNKAPEYHITFAKCLSILRPSDYLTRAEHLLLGGQEDLAAQLYFIGLLRMLRECEPIRNDFRQRVCAMMHQFGYGNLYSSLLDAYDLYYKHRYAEAAALLDRVELIYPEVLLAERDYLLALCKLKKFNSAENAKADQILQPWERLRNHEPDLWSRIQMTRLAICTRNNEFDQARKIERNLGNYYNNLRRSDPSAETAINILRRKSATLYGAEIAAERCRTAVAYFGTGDGGALPRSPVQYYMGLCNLSGNLLVIGEFVEARQTSERAANFWQKCQDLAIPRLEVAINNLLVSSVVSGAMNAKDAERTMNELDFDSPESPDRYLLTNNLIIFIALTGNLQEALRQAERTFASLGSNTSDDSYYRYFIGTNLAGILHLVGETRKATTLWRQLRPPEIPQADMPFLNARHSGQQDALKSVKKGDIEGWDQFLSRKHTSLLGRPWAFYGRGFLFSDIQFWSES